MKEVLEIFRAHGFFWGFVALAIMTILELSKRSPFNPWTWLFRRLGRAINGELIVRVEALEKQAHKLETTAGEQKAINCRSRILRFGDETTRGVKHSEEYFNQILDDVTEYEKYCREHPEFTNNKTELTVKRIKKCYSERLEKNDFL